MGQYTSYYLYQRYEQRDGQDPIPTYPNQYSIDGNGTEERVVRAENDRECGYDGDCLPIYKWVDIPISEEYECNECEINIETQWVTTSAYTYFGDYRYEILKEQYRKDGGQWLDTSNEKYANPVEVSPKTKVTFDNGDIFTESCGSENGGWNSSVDISNGFYASTSIEQHTTNVVRTNYNGEYIVLHDYRNNIATEARDVKKIEFGDCVYEIGVRKYTEYGNDVLESGGLNPSNFNASGWGVEELVLPQTLKWIGAGCFDNNDLKSITIPSSVETIGALYNQRKSGSIITSTLYGGFSANRKLKEINFNEGLKSIGKRCFNDCISLERIELPLSLEALGDNVFSGCTHLKQIIFKNPTPPSFMNALDVQSGLYVQTSHKLSACSDTYVYVPCGSKNAYTEVISDLPSERVVEYGGNCGNMPSIENMYNLVCSYTISGLTTNLYNGTEDWWWGDFDADYINSQFDYADELVIGAYPSTVSGTIESNLDRIIINANTVEAFNANAIEVIYNSDGSYNRNFVSDDKSMINVGVENVIISGDATINSDFVSCVHLSSVTINSNATIQYDSFKDCHNLNDVYINYSGNVLSVTTQDSHVPFSNSNPTVHVPCELYDLYKSHSFWSTKNIVRDSDSCQGAYLNIISNTYGISANPPYVFTGDSTVYGTYTDGAEMEIKTKGITNITFQHVVCGEVGRRKYNQFYLDGSLFYEYPCGGTSVSRTGYVTRTSMDIPQDGSEHTIRIVSVYTITEGRANYFSFTYV